jgi:hypothetical protein
MAFYKTLDVIAASCAAYRVNNNQIIQDNSKSELTPNIKLVCATLIGNGFPDAVTLTEEDHAHANEIVEFLTHQNTLMTLVGKEFNEFTANILKFITVGQTNVRFFSLVMWAPKLHVDMQLMQEKQRQLATLSYGSKYLGKLKGKVEIDFVPIVKRYNKHYQAWRYTGHDTHGNLVGFFSNQNFTKEQFKIKGHIKSLETSRFAENGKTTYLSHVKEIA